MNDLARIDDTQIDAPVRATLEIEKAKAIQEIQAQFVIAKKFPRDEIGAEARIMKACERYSLAEQAGYAYPRAGEKVEGPSIRLAEAMAQSWGNLNYGFRVTNHLAEQSEVETFCLDLETNTKASRSFVVEHAMMVGKGAEKRRKTLTDPRDIYEHVANNSQRRVRACILEIIPGDVVEKAVKRCKQTLIKGQGNVPLQDRIVQMVELFAKLGVTKDLIERRLGHTIDKTNAEELADFQQIYNSMRDSLSKREDWFDFGGVSEGGKAAELRERMNAKKEIKAPQEPEPVLGQKEADPNSFDNFKQ